MDEAQATEIRDHLLDVDYMLSEAIAAVSHLPQADKKVLTRPLEKLLKSLHDKVLRLISDQHPELIAPSDDIFTICCDLRWKEVTLPPSISEADLDAVILSSLRPRSLKVAKVLSDVMKALEDRGHSIDTDVVSARIRWLDDVDRIESRGDVRKWRHSEVALKA
jgi:hypothetical protein